MEKVIFFIDGFNLYHAINNNKFKKYKWLNYSQLANKLILKKTQTVKDIYFFSALHWNNDSGKISRHKKYLNALKEVNIKIVLGKFKERDKYCNLCKRKFITHEEKQTDVNIALHLLKLAYKNEYDIAMILSGDSDLIPALKEVKKEYPEKKMIIVLPPYRSSDNLKNVADSNIKLNENHLKNNQFPDKIYCKDGTLVEKPQEWF